MPKAETIATSAQKIAQQQGITKYDLYGSSVDGTNVQVYQGKPKQVKASNRSSIIVRVWNDDGRVGVTSTTDVDANGIELALKTAQEASNYGAEDNIPDFSPAATEETAAIEREASTPAPVTTLIDKLLGAEKELLAAHSAIKGVPYNGLSQQDIDRFYINSAGALRQESLGLTSLYLYSKTEVEGKKTRSAGAFRISNSLDTLDIAGCLEEAAEKTISHLNYEKVKSGKYPVVFSPDAFLSLLGAFGNLFNAQSILDKQSLSTTESLGQAIATPLISVYDDALHPDNVAPETFDGEGTPTRRIPIIHEGILTNFIHSSSTAKRLNTEPTGHGNIGAKVTVRPHFFHVTPGQAAASEYNLATADGVIFVDELKALHAGVSALQGSFSLPFDGWFISQGKLVSIESATVAGDIRELMQSIMYVEEEAQLRSSGVCPRIWVEGLSITGD